MTETNNYELVIEDLKTRISALEAQIKTLHPRTWPGAPGVTADAGVNIHPTVSMIASQGRFIHLGARTKILRDAEWVGPIRVGSGCYINRSSYIRANVTIGDDVLIGPFARIVTDMHDIGPSSKRGGVYRQAQIRIEDGVWMGACVTIVGNVTVGRGAVVAAGAVVVKDVPANTLVAGVPAKVVKHFVE